MPEASNANLKAGFNVMGGGAAPSREECQSQAYFRQAENAQGGASPGDRKTTDHSSCLLRIARTVAKWSYKTLVKRLGGSLSLVLHQT